MNVVCQRHREKARVVVEIIVNEGGERKGKTVGQTCKDQIYTKC